MRALLLSVDDDLYLYTLEPGADQSKGMPYRIPAGAYEVQPQ